MTKNQTLIQDRFPDLNWSFDFPLAQESYFKVGGPAEIFIELKDFKTLAEILLFCQEQGIPWRIIGGASNLIIADQGVKGLVARFKANQFTVLSDTEQQLVFEAEAGIKTSALVIKSAKYHATGLEGFIGVPGTLGGAIYNNAHYLDYLIADYIEFVTLFHVKQNKILTISRENCQFAYEQSIFQANKNLFILKAQFKLAKADPELIQSKLQEAQQRRLKTQPLNLPSSGCIFQNPKNTPALKKRFPQFAQQDFIPAGFLIDQAGLKGEQIGQIAVSDKHAAFMVNLASQEQAHLAKAKDIKKLIILVKDRVKEKFQLDLEEEIFYLGGEE